MHTCIHAWDEADHAALKREAERLQVKPGILARMLLHAGLKEDPPASEPVTIVIDANVLVALLVPVRLVA